MAAYLASRRRRYGGAVQPGREQLRPDGKGEDVEPADRTLHVPLAAVGDVAHPPEDPPVEAELELEGGGRDPSELARSVELDRDRRMRPGVERPDERGELVPRLDGVEQAEHVGLPEQPARDPPPAALRPGALEPVCPCEPA